MKRHTNSTVADIWLYCDFFLCLHEEYHIDLKKTFILGAKYITVLFCLRIAAKASDVSCTQR